MSSALRRDGKSPQLKDHEKRPRISIQSKDHEKLLNNIDNLRSQGISRFIDLPQIIVCGDQSSGKSSVLEAVSGLKFPTKDNLCTRFATELILRRNAEITSTATIVGVQWQSRTDEERKRIADFMTDLDVYENLGSIVEEAGKAMGLDQSSKVFSNDVLRIELSGPQQSHLTLVDLLGSSILEASRNQQLLPMHIILAVVSAKNDFNNQIVTKYAIDYDPQGARTLGIITKPDTLHAGSDSGKQSLELAENKDVHLRLGWLVLKSRDYEQRKCTNEERDKDEKAFFSKGIWTSLGPKQLGFEPLRPRLSRFLQNQILRELPNLMNDVETGLKECQGRLDVLGAPRGSHQEQRLYLHAVRDSFTPLMRDAVHGRYDGGYFGDVTTDDGYAKRIRAVINNELEHFAEDMRERGHKYKIVREDDEAQSDETPYTLTKADRMSKVKELIKRNRGKELSTISKEDTITALFREQSAPWVALANKYAAKIYEKVRTGIMSALQSSCDQVTLDAVLSHTVNPALNMIKQNFEEAVSRISKQHVNGHPITYNHYLTDNLQKARNEHHKEHNAQILEKFFRYDVRLNVTETLSVHLSSLLDALSLPTEADMTTFACSEALHIMEAYYKVALKNFVDNFAVYAVEQELLAKLETIFTPATIFKLSEDVIEDIAGETEESKDERESSSTRLATLKCALDILKRLDRGHIQGTTKALVV